MRQILLIVILAFFLFLIEWLLFDLIGRWCVPNLLLLLVIFMTLYSGIRYGLAAAFTAGFVRDSFAVVPAGSYLLSFVLCAFATVFLKKYIYHAGSRSSRVLLVFIVSLIHLTALLFLNLRVVSVSLGEVFNHIVISEIVMTLFVTHFTFYHLKACVSKFYV